MAVHQLLQRQVGRDLGPADRLGGAARKPLGNPVTRLVQLLGRHDIAQQAEPLGFGGAQDVSGQQILLGLRIAHELRPQQSAAVARHQAYLHMRVANLDASVRHHDVATHRQRGAEAHGMAIEAAHQRLGQVKLRIDDRLGFGRDGLELSRPVDRRLHPVQIAARAESLAVAGEHDHVRLGVCGGVREHTRKLCVQPAIDGIELVRTVEPDHEHALATLELDALVVVPFHGDMCLLQKIRARAMGPSCLAILKAARRAPWSESRIHSAPVAQAASAREKASICASRSPSRRLVTMTRLK